jgi:hypothetical protein
VLGTESTVTSNRRDSYTSCNPKPWILNRVQDDREIIIPFQDNGKATFADKTRHTVIPFQNDKKTVIPCLTRNPQSQATREIATSCNSEPWILNRVQDDREIVISFQDDGKATFVQKTHHPVIPCSTRNPQPIGTDAVC